MGKTDGKPLTVIGIRIARNESKGEVQVYRNGQEPEHIEIPHLNIHVIQCLIINVSYAMKQRKEASQNPE